MTDQKLKSSRPYLIRAMHEWISDNGETPLVVVDATVDDVQVPAQHVKDGRIVLNVSWSATSGLEMDNEAISFNARFSGVGQSVYLPIDSVVGIYARESGQGMVFQDEPDAETAGGPAASAADPANKPQDDGPDSGPSGNKGKPGLRLVK